VEIIHKAKSSKEIFVALKLEDSPALCKVDLFKRKINKIR
jgi:hypothetical protein